MRHFYNKVEHKIDSMESFKKVAVAPSNYWRYFCVRWRCGVGCGGQQWDELGVSLLPHGHRAFDHLVAPFLPDYKQNDWAGWRRAEGRAR